MNDLYLVNFALSFSRHFTLRQSTAHILEIGAGYGGTVAKLARLIPNAQFVLVDLPPASLLQAFYLNELFPDDVTVIPLGSDLSAMRSGRKFIVCGPPAVAQSSVHLSGVINTRSFGEMERPVVAQYFRLIERDLGSCGIFMNVNRLQKIGYRFTAYPYDDRWDVVESRAAFAQGALWHLTTRRRDSVNREFARWTAAVPMPPAPNLMRRLVSQVRRIL
jgi:SAM-dependent methyltransferase